MRKVGNGLGFKVGIPALLEHDGLEGAAGMCREQGLDFVELNMNLPWCLPEKMSAEYAVRVQEEYGVFFTLHFSEGVDFGAFSVNARDSAVRLFKEACSFAADANIRLINVHVDEGVYLTLPTEKVWLYEKYNEEFVANNLDSLGKMARFAKNKKVLLCVENTIFPSFFEKAFAELIGIKNLNFTWDIGHDATSSYRFSRFVKKNNVRLAHVHIHDFDGIMNHQTLFSGVLDIEQAFETARNCNATAVVEVKTGNELVASINKARNKGVI